MQTSWDRVLPDAPRRAKAGRKSKKIAKSVLLGLVALPLGGLVLYFAVQWLSDLLTDRRVFAEGVPADFGEVSGEERSKNFVFHTYDLRIVYDDAQGTRRESSQEFTTIFGTVDTDTPPEVRYLPAEPNRAASSWSVEVTASRMAWVAVAFAAGLVLLSIMVVAVFAVRDAVLEERAAIEGLETRAAITSVNADQHGNTTYAFRVEVPSEGRSLESRVVLRGKGPWLVDETTAVALYLPSHRRVFLVESDGEPLEQP